MELRVKTESMLHFCPIARQEPGELVSGLGLYGRVRSTWLAVGGGPWLPHSTRTLAAGEDLLMTPAAGPKPGFPGTGFLGDGGTGDIPKEPFWRVPLKGERGEGLAVKAAALCSFWIQTITHSEGFFCLNLSIMMLIKLLFPIARYHLTL